MYKKTSNSWLKHLDFMLLDLVCLQISFLLAYLIRHGLHNPYKTPLYLNMSIILTLIQVLVIFFFETLKNVLKRGYYKELVITLKHDSLVILFASFYLFITQKGEIYSRSTLVYTFFLYLLFSYTIRIFWKHYLRLRRKKEGSGRSLLIITASQEIKDVIKNIKSKNYEGFRIAGIVVIDESYIGKEIDGVKVVADKTSVVEYVCREWIDEIFINLHESDPYCSSLVEQFMEMGLTTHIKLASVSELALQKQYIERLGMYTVLTTSVNMATTKQLFMKRFLDILGGMVGCAVTCVLFIFVAPCIYIKSPGPIFFSQQRVGKNGRKFRIFKFRSMYLDAEEKKKELMEHNRVKDGRMFKLDSDPRIIGSEKGQGKGIGNFIRKYSIDEWPQFFNVLKGDMSLVGTRPPTVDEWEKYDLRHRARLAVKPGLTGMWQVSGRSDITDFEEVVALDTKYIMEWSFALDLKILFRTVYVVLKRDGSL